MKGLMLWRRLSAFLMHQCPRSRTHLEPPPSIKPQIEALAAALGDFLGQFANRDANTNSLSAQRANLEAVIADCAGFGYRLFSDPYAWRFIFDDSRTSQQQDSLIVRPGLKKLSNDEGELYEYPLVVVEPMMEPIMEGVDNPET